MRTTAYAVVLASFVAVLLAFATAPSIAAVPVSNPTMDQSGSTGNYQGTYYPAYFDTYPTSWMQPAGAAGGGTGKAAHSGTYYPAYFDTYPTSWMQPAGAAGGGTGKAAHGGTYYPAYFDTYPSDYGR